MYVAVQNPSNFDVSQISHSVPKLGYSKASMYDKIKGGFVDVEMEVNCPHDAIDLG